jgi:rod shape-determining protein MreD
MLKKTTQMSKQLSKISFVWLILILSSLLSIIPLPEYLSFLRVPWIALSLIFFTIMTPSIIGLFSAFLIGLILDILQGGILGESSLALSFITYITYRFRLQIRVFPIWQMMLTILILLTINEMMHLWIEGMTGKIVISQSRLLSILLGSLIWPFFMGLMQNLQSRIKN